MFDFHGHYWDEEILMTPGRYGNLVLPVRDCAKMISS